MDMDAFRAKSNFMDRLYKDATMGTISASALLRSFNLELDDLALQSDILPSTAKTYEAIANNLSWPELATSLDYMLNKYPMVIFRHSSFVPTIVASHPEAISFLFPKIYSRSLGTSQTQNTKYLANILVQLITAADKATATRYITNVCMLPEVSKKLILDEFDKIYETRTDLRDILFVKFLENCNTQTPDGRKHWFSFLEHIIKCDNDKIPLCLDRITDYITDVGPNENDKGGESTYDHIINALLYVYTLPKYQDTASMLFDILKQQKITKKQRRTIARVLGETELLRSSVTFGHRINKTEENVYGFEHVNSVPIEKPCVVVFGGTGTTDSQSLNGYMSSIETLLKSKGIGSDLVEIYGVVYDFGDRQDNAFHDGTARFLQMMQYKHAKKIQPLQVPSPDDLDPQYVHQIFDKVFLPRIAQNGKRLPLEVAQRNIRNITIVAHCHGAYTFLKIEEMMRAKMRELGYSPTECAQIQKKLLCVAYAPYCPLGVSKSVMISFASVNDFDVNHRNRFYNFIREIHKNHGIKSSWFPGRRGNIFIVPTLRKTEYSEDHDMIEYDTTAKNLSDDGKKLVKFMGNTIVFGVIGSILGGPLPKAETMMTTGNADDIDVLNTSTQNGEDIYAQIITRIQQSHLQNRQLYSESPLVFWHELFGKLRKSESGRI